MARRPFIASSSNVRLKAVRRLARTGSPDVFLAEGCRAVRSAFAAGVRVRELFVAPELFLGDEDAPLVAALERSGAAVVEVGAGAFRTVARSARPDGVLAIVERPATSLAQLALRRDPLVVVAARIERPGNLGAIVRTACAAGADAVLVADPVTDVFGRDVVRGSVGAIFRLPVVVVEGPPARAWLREHRIRLVAATPSAAQPYWQVRYGGGVAILVGSESRGLPVEWVEAADELVAVPMPGPADSLNVAVAAGVVLFEAARRRPPPRSPASGASGSGRPSAPV